MENVDKVSVNRDFWDGRRVFVTGATGFLGSWLTKYLCDAGAHVVCLIRDRVPESNFYLLGLKEKLKIVRGDFNDFETVNRTLNEYETESVFHIGAQTIVSIANRNPVPTLKNNINGTINVLESCRLNSTVKRIVVASSDKAYGTSSILPYDESVALKGEHPYDVSKSCTDLISNAYHKTYGLPVCITRCGNLYGGGDLNFNRIVPGIIQDVFKRREPIIRSDGMFVRNYFYVKDAAAAYIKLAENMESKEIIGEAFNFGSDERISVIELVNKILEVMKSDLKPKVLNEVKNEIKEQYLSSSKAERMLGWKAKYGLNEGLRETADWYLNFLARRA